MSDIDSTALRTTSPRWPSSAGTDPGSRGQRAPRVALYAPKWPLGAGRHPGGAGIGGGGAYAWTVVNPSVSSKYDKVAYIVPTAPRLTARTGETIYRIDPTASKASYGVDEKIVGARLAHHATGSTQGIVVGDLAVNLRRSLGQPGRRDRDRPRGASTPTTTSATSVTIRKDFLSSHTNPLARFTGTSITGLPAKLVDGTWYSFSLVGNLTVKGKTAPGVVERPGRVRRRKAQRHSHHPGEDVDLRHRSRSRSPAWSAPPTTSTSASSSRP